MFVVLCDLGEADVQGSAVDDARPRADVDAGYTEFQPGGEACGVFHLVELEMDNARVA